MNKVEGALLGSACLLILLWVVVFNAAFFALAWWTWGMYEAPTLVKVAAVIVAYFTLGALMQKARN